MLQVLRDLFRHGAWADAAHLRAIEACAAARDDDELRRRLHHIQLAQGAYLAFLRGEPEKALEGRLSFDELWQAIRRCHEEYSQWLDTITDDQLRDRLTYPEAEYGDSSVAELILQAALHSHYHRGQNAARLRQLGGEPPVIEYLAWVRLRRPSAAW